MRQKKTPLQAALQASYVSLHDSNARRESFNSTHRQQIKSWKKWFGNWLPAEKHATILELGSGEGDFLFWLQSLGYENALGVELSAQQIAKAAALGVQGQINEDAIVYLKRSSQTYSLVVMRDFLEHLDKERVLQTLKLISRNLLPSGFCIIQVPNGASPFFGNIFYGDFTHQTVFTQRSINQIFPLVGLELVTVFGIEPVIHGWKSLLRLLVWKMVKSFYWLCLSAESGPQATILTQNIVVLARKIKPRNGK